MLYCHHHHFLLDPKECRPGCYKECCEVKPGETLCTPESKQIDICKSECFNCRKRSFKGMQIILHLGFLTFYSHFPCSAMRPALQSLPVIQNSQHGLQNPRLSWITLHGAIFELERDLFKLKYYAYLDSIKTGDFSSVFRRVRIHS